VRRGAVAGAVGGASLLAFYVLPISDSRPQPVEVSMVEYAFVPSELHAVPGQRLHVVNDGAIPHSILIVGTGKGVELPPGAEQTFRLPSDLDGDYVMLCDLPGHTEAGMTGRLIIDD
jgi:plastocyanin